MVGTRRSVARFLSAVFRQVRPLPGLGGGLLHWRYGESWFGADNGVEWSGESCNRDDTTNLLAHLSDWGNGDYTSSSRKLYCISSAERHYPSGPAGSQECKCDVLQSRHDRGTGGISDAGLSHLPRLISSKQAATGSDLHSTIGGQHEKRNMATIL